MLKMFNTWIDNNVQRFGFCMCLVKCNDFHQVILKGYCWICLSIFTIFRYKISQLYVQCFDSVSSMELRRKLFGFVRALKPEALNQTGRIWRGSEHDVIDLDNVNEPQWMKKSQIQQTLERFTNDVFSEADFWSPNELRKLQFERKLVKSNQFATKKNQTTLCVNSRPSYRLQRFVFSFSFDWCDYKLNVVKMSLEMVHKIYK